jgi:hypothetical protein
MKQAPCQTTEKDSRRPFFLRFGANAVSDFFSTCGCGSNGGDHSGAPVPTTPEGCRQYPMSFEGYRYEWDDDQNAIIGYHIRSNCLARTRTYFSKSDFIEEIEVFGLDLATEYDDIDCMAGGPSFFTTNTFDGSKLIATSYRIDDIDTELYEYTWDVHDQDNRPISGSRKVRFGEYGEVLAVMCDQQPVRRTYFDEKRMILEERFLAEIIYPLQEALHPALKKPGSNLFILHGLFF